MFLPLPTVDRCISRSPLLQEITVTWDDYHRKVEQLAVVIYDSGWQFDQLVCLAKGGLRIGDIFARLYGVPLAILSASSYGGADGRQRGQLVFSRELSMTTLNLGRRVLLVDDLADSGWTLKARSGMVAMPLWLLH